MYIKPYVTKPVERKYNAHHLFNAYHLLYELTKVIQQMDLVSYHEWLVLVSRITNQKMKKLNNGI